MKPLNLAAQPFRNERLGEAVFAAGAFLLLALTAWHALVIRNLLPARTSALHREVASLDAELLSLRREARDQRTETPPAPVLAEWTLVKDLVDRRAFSWTGLFASLEEVIPLDVRLKAITPEVRKGQLRLELTATVRNGAAGWEFVRVLEETGEFYDVYPTSEADRDFRYTMRYRPRREREMVGPPAPPAEAGGTPYEDAADPDENAAAEPPGAAGSTAAASPELVGPPEPGRGSR